MVGIFLGAPDAAEERSWQRRKITGALDAAGIGSSRMSESRKLGRPIRGTHSQSPVEKRSL